MNVTRKRSTSVGRPCRDAQDYLAWHAQHGVHKTGEEDTVDEYSDEQGEEDGYQQKRSRKDALLLMREDAEEKYRELVDFFRHHAPRIGVNPPRSLPDGRFCYPLQGVQSTRELELLVTRHRKKLNVTIDSGQGQEVTDEGTFVPQAYVHAVYDPGDLLNDFFLSRTYRFKVMTGLSLMALGLWLIWYAWGQLSVYINIGALVHVVCVAAMPVAMPNLSTGVFAIVAIGALLALQDTPELLALALVGAIWATALTFNGQYRLLKRIAAVPLSLVALHMAAPHQPNIWTAARTLWTAGHWALAASAVFVASLGAWLFA